MGEATWLVNSHSEAFGTMMYNEDRLAGTGGAGEPDSAVNMAVSNESGELLQAGDASLDQMHEDALRQAGCGLSQARIIVACGLAVAGSTLELASVPFILPSAEIELCILPHEKNWLVLISLVGCSVGSACWGALSSRVGRRRALVSALAVNAVFAAVAAFMPTYGTFMMARLCSAFGSGGIVPISFAYCWSVIASGQDAGRARSRALAGLAGGATVGALLSGALAAAILPQTGESALQDDKDHFSNWHRYLLVCTLPLLASLVLLTWTQESPRYLLQAGKQADAMAQYQSIYNGNQFRLCGKANVAAANNRAPSYHLGELSLPGKQRHSPHCKHSLEMFWIAIFELFSSTYRRSTLCLGGILLFTMTLQLYLSSYVPETVLFTQTQLFEANRQTVANTSMYNEHLNTTIENVVYYNVTFNNCTFRDMLISHVEFKNCSFYDVAFFNIQTSYTMFKGCVLVNSTIIDTDMEEDRELDEWCELNNTVIRGMQAGCARRADLTTNLQSPIREQTYLSYAMLVATVLALLPSKLRPLSLICGLCLLLSPSLYWCGTESALYAVESIYRALLTLAWLTVGILTTDTYPPHHRCTAHGLILSVSYAGCAIVRGAGSGGAATSSLVCAGLSGGALLLALRNR